MRMKNMCQIVCIAWCVWRSPTSFPSLVRRHFALHEKLSVCVRSIELLCWIFPSKICMCVCVWWLTSDARIICDTHSTYIVVCNGSHFASTPCTMLIIAVILWHWIRIITIDVVRCSWILFFFLVDTHKMEEKKDQKIKKQKMEKILKTTRRYAVHVCVCVCAFANVERKPATKRTTKRSSRILVLNTRRSLICVYEFMHVVYKSESHSQSQSRWLKSRAKNRSEREEKKNAKNEKCDDWRRNRGKKQERSRCFEATGASIIMCTSTTCREWTRETN